VFIRFVACLTAFALQVFNSFFRVYILQLGLFDYLGLHFGFWRLFMIIGLLGIVVQHPKADSKLSEGQKAFTWTILLFITWLLIHLGVGR
jgi:hypothetical protein